MCFSWDSVGFPFASVFRHAGFSCNVYTEVDPVLNYFHFWPQWGATELHQWPFIEASFWWQLGSTSLIQCNHQLLHISCSQCRDLIYALFQPTPGLVKSRRAISAVPERGLCTGTGRSCCHRRIRVGSGRTGGGSGRAGSMPCGRAVLGEAGSVNTGSKMADKYRWVGCRILLQCSTIPCGRIYYFWFGS